MEFDKSYFLNYDNEGGSYAKTYQGFTSVNQCLRDIKSLPIKTVMVLGCATGEVLRDFLKRGYDPQGIEVSGWAVTNCLPAMRKRIVQADMRAWLRDYKGPKFDLIYTNALVYCTKEDIGETLRLIARNCKYACFLVATVEHPVSDKWRTLTEHESWWGSLFDKFFNPLFSDLWEPKHQSFIISKLKASGIGYKVVGRATEAKTSEPEPECSLCRDRLLNCPKCKGAVLKRRYKEFKKSHPDKSIQEFEYLQRKTRTYTKTYRPKKNFLG